MSLVIRDKAISEIPVALQPYIAARLTDPISKIGNFDLENRVKDILLRAHFEMGIHVPSDRVISSLREILTKDLRAKRYATVGIQEIELFISNGIRGEYGTFKSQLSAVNIQNIHYWIKSGLESKQRELAMKAYIDKIDEIERSKEPVVMCDEWWQNQCLKVFDNYRSGRDMETVFFSSGAAAKIYDFINERIGTEVVRAGKTIKTLIPDPDVAMDIFRITKQLCSKKEIKENGTLFKKYFASDNFEWELKRQYLIHFFDTLIETGKGLEL